jgi:hypothetical protein
VILHKRGPRCRLVNHRKAGGRREESNMAGFLYNDTNHITMDVLMRCSCRRKSLWYHHNLQFARIVSLLEGGVSSATRAAPASTNREAQDYHGERHCICGDVFRTSSKVQGLRWSTCNHGTSDSQRHLGADPSTPEQQTQTSSRQPYALESPSQDADRRQHIVLVSNR